MTTPLRQIFPPGLGVAAALAVALGLSGCKTDGIERLPHDPPLSQLRSDKAECLAKGGNYQRGGIIGYVCYLPTIDAGKSCKSEGDCNGLCLAETRQCSAVTPMFGCVSLLDYDGKIVEMCID